jgi:hypothetical protein
MHRRLASCRSPSALVNRNTHAVWHSRSRSRPSKRLPLDPTAIPVCVSKSYYLSAFCELRRRKHRALNDRMNQGAQAASFGCGLCQDSIDVFTIRKSEFPPESEGRQLFRQTAGKSLVVLQQQSFELTHIGKLLSRGKLTSRCCSHCCFNSRILEHMAQINII